MATAKIGDFAHSRDLAQRQAFRAAVHRAEAGEEVAFELAWGDDVELLERGATRTRIDAAGRPGFVANEHVAELGHLRSYESRGRRYHVVPLYREPTGSAVQSELLWGDRLLILERGEHRTRVRARNRVGWLDDRAVGDRGLLELYFIDVGQGDGILIRTPGGRHVMIDGGYRRAKQPTHKSAADFVDWKFYADYQDTHVRLDAMIASHCDADHYGGLWDLVSDDPGARAELDTGGTDVAAFYHAGVSWWRPGDRWLGRERDGYLVDLLDDARSVRTALEPRAERRLQGEWADFLRDLLATTENIRRLGVDRERSDAVHLPSFSPDDGDVSVEVLAPITDLRNGDVTVRDLGNDAQNTNGHSILLRLSYGGFRCLLTGDLNQAAMRDLLTALRGRESVLACDVAKACHHGSDDVSYEFLQHVRAAATVISSGDHRGHGHPRPAILAASAITGHCHIDVEQDRLLTPLIYSTEVERGVRVGRIDKIEAEGYPQDGDAIDVRLYGRDPEHYDGDERTDALAKRAVRTRAEVEETASGALRATRRRLLLHDRDLVTGLTYGLVNVRTDGDTVLCATLDEGGAGWQATAFPARFGYRG